MNKHPYNNRLASPIQQTHFFLVGIQTVPYVWDGQRKPLLESISRIHTQMGLALSQEPIFQSTNSKDGRV